MKLKKANLFSSKDFKCQICAVLEPFQNRIENSFCFSPSFFSLIVRALRMCIICCYETSRKIAVKRILGIKGLSLAGFKGGSTGMQAYCVVEHQFSWGPLLLHVSMVSK